MARAGLMVKANRVPKFEVRAYNRCVRCGRSRSVFRYFKLCRLCMRELAHKGQLPGVKKASW